MAHVPRVSGIALSAVVAALSSCGRGPAAIDSDSGVPMVDAGQSPDPAPSANPVTSASEAPQAPTSPTTAPTASPHASPFVSGETWSGSYQCRGAQPALELRIVHGGPEVSAEFDFSYKNGPKGAFETKGSYEASGRHLRLEPGNWIRRPAYFVPLSLDGSVSADGHTYLGTVRGGGGCTTFSVRR